MDRFKTVLENVWLCVRKVRAHLLAKLYARCRETYTHTAGKNKCRCEDYCDSIERICRDVGVDIPETGRNENVPATLKRFMMRRYSWSVRCTFYKGKLAERQIFTSGAKGFSEVLGAWEKLNVPVQVPGERLQGKGRSASVVMPPRTPRSSPPEQIRKTAPPSPASTPQETSLTTIAGAIIDNSF